MGVAIATSVSGNAMEAEQREGVQLGEPSAGETGPAMDPDYQGASRWAYGEVVKWMASRRSDGGGFWLVHDRE